MEHTAFNQSGYRRGKMTIHSAVQRPVSAWKGLGMEERLNAIGDFIIGVGGVQDGYMVADVNGCNAVLAPRLHRLGARVLKVEGWRSSSQQPLSMASGCLDVLFATVGFTSWGRY